MLPLINKLIAGLLFLFWLGSTGCVRNVDSSSAQMNEDVLVVWHAYRGDEQRALEDAVRQAETEQPGMHVRLINVPYDAFANKISVAVPRGNGPDLFIYAHDRIGDWARSGLLEPLGFWADEGMIDRFFSNTVNALVFEHELYALPLAFKTLALYYDRQVADSPPRTTDELIAASATVRRRNAAHWGLAYEMDSLYFHAPWLHGFGGQVYLDENDVLDLDSHASARSVEFVRSLVTKHRISPEEVTSALVTALFNQHKLAFDQRIAPHTGPKMRACRT